MISGSIHFFSLRGLYGKYYKHCRGVHIHSKPDKYYCRSNRSSDQRHFAGLSIVVFGRPGCKFVNIHTRGGRPFRIG